jgi:hypothetical protein
LKVPGPWLPGFATRDAVVKLRRYFRQMGFERIGLSMARRTPTLGELLRPEGEVRP